MLEAKNLGTYQGLQQRRGRWEEEGVLGGERYFSALPDAAAVMAASGNGDLLAKEKGGEEQGRMGGVLRRRSR